MDYLQKVRLNLLLNPT